MQLLHFEITKSTDINTFVAFWSQLYSYAKEKLYYEAITKKRVY